MVVIVLFWYGWLFFAGVWVWVAGLRVAYNGRCWARTELWTFCELLLHSALFLPFSLPLPFSLSLSLPLSLSLFFFLHLIMSSLFLSQSLLLFPFSLLKLIFRQYLHRIALLTTLFIIASLLADLPMKSLSVFLNRVFCILINRYLNHSIVSDFFSFIVKVLHVWMTQCLFDCKSLFWIENQQFS